MGVHKLTAGDGYTYLTRQVAAHDATNRGHQGLADYYAEKGESPGRWFGTGLTALDVDVGSEVTEAQMRNLFGEGRHPNAEHVECVAHENGASVEEAKKLSQLGRVFARYLGNQPEFIRETAKRYVAFNLTRGVHWKTPVPADVRADIRTQLADEHFDREHGRPPLDDRERGSFMAKATRQQTTAVAGYDLTFAPVKSVSTLWALADPDVAHQIEDAHHEAVETTLRWLEKEVLFTRRGRGGVQQVRTHGLIAGMFTHRDARSSDPHLHTHVALSNKVQDGSGRWLAVDGRVLFKANVSLAETYNSLLEAELIGRLGVRFEERGGPQPGQSRQPPQPTSDGKRSVREIVGVDPRLAQAWSKRHRDIESRRRALASAFQARHGRPPTDGEAVTLAEQAWDQTRQAKHAPRAAADQRAAWLREASAILGSRAAVRDMIGRCLGHRHDSPELTDAWVADIAERVVRRVAHDRATWQVWHLRAEAQRRARAAGVRRDDLSDVVDQVVLQAIHEHSIPFTEADPLLRETTAAAEGVSIPDRLQRVEHLAYRDEVVSVYSLAGARQYTSRAVMDAERRILAAACRTGCRTVSAVRVGITIAAATAAAEQTTVTPSLNAAQQSMVREMATSGRAVQLALAPAGTGKTTAMQVLTHVWQDSGGTVVGLAPSAVAAQELSSAINSDTGGPNAPAAGRRHRRAARRDGRPTVRTDTLAKLVWHAGNGRAPAWMDRIDASTLVLIDEAGMAATTDLATAIDYVTSRGAQVRMIGDDRQLASVAAGGTLRDIVHQVGAVTLSEVHRFRNADGSPNHAEAAATLALRDGDPSAIAFYTDRGRVHVGDLGTCADQAYAAWARERTAGVPMADSILIASTRELVAELNTRARADRLARHKHSDRKDIGRELSLVDGTQVSSGDPVITRQNDRRLTLSPTNWVKNGDRWHVRHVHPDGSLRVSHDHLGTTITLPADYVSHHVQLGYATTVHGAQGITTGTSHVVLTGDEDRNLLYVALSRGRLANHLYLNVASDGDPHNLIKPDALLAPTAVDRITAMLRRDGSPTSATTTQREQLNPQQLLADLAARYHDAVTTGAETLLGSDALTRIDLNADALMPDLTDAPAWPTLRSHLALASLNGHDPTHLLTSAHAIASIDDARDPAAVLDARIDHLLHEPNLPAVATPVSSSAHAAARNTRSDQPAEAGPLPWLPSIPTQLATEPSWGPFVSTYHRLVVEQAAAVSTDARRWNSSTAPVWAQPFLEDEATDLRTKLAIWRAATGTHDTDLRPTGEHTIGTPGTYQAQLKRYVRATRPGYPFRQRNWYRQLLDAIHADPWATALCQRLARLERAGLPVSDYLHGALNSDPSQTGTARPLPDEQPAAALWWRLVPHLGPVALAADERTSDLLRPPWCDDLVDLVGESKAHYLQQTSAWPALVAAVDEARIYRGWEPRETLASAINELPRDGTLSGNDVADAIVLRIAMLTDEPTTPAEPVDPSEMSDPDLGSSHRTSLVPPLKVAEDVNPQPPASTPQRVNEDPYALPLPYNEADTVTPEDAFPRPGEVPAARLRELNQQALDYYCSLYPRSWGPDYLRLRLGTDLMDHPRHAVGYAPGSGQSLIRHLTARGATLDELDQAGLVSYRRREDGTTYCRDAFRDRLILPIWDPQPHAGASVLGFVGRRNPMKTDSDYAGPKYLNTRTTSIFVKGEALFGYAGWCRDAASNALPVLVEGPLDAIAITTASGGAHFGVAPLGTALTVAQVKLLRAHLDAIATQTIAVATDADAAGWLAAETAFWHLSAADIDAQLVPLPDGLDPAQLLEVQGAEALRLAIKNSASLGDVLIANLLHMHGRPGSEQADSTVVRQAARVIGSRRADTWPAQFERLTNALRLAPGVIEQVTISESLNRDRDPLAYVHARIDELRAKPESRTAVRAQSKRPTGWAAPHTPTDHLEQSQSR